MATESRRAKEARAEVVYDLLASEHPDAACALRYRSPFELLAATILSAQCTDEQVNRVTPRLFDRFPGPAELAAARPEEVEEIVHSTGFFRTKTKNLIAMAALVAGKHRGETPKTMEELTALPGVGRKTANVLLGNAFGLDEGVVVDTHVKRLARRLGFSREKTPEKIERELMKLFPRRRWTMLAHLLIFHGRRVCAARKPRCEACALSPLCPSSRV